MVEKTLGNKFSLSFSGHLFLFLGKEERNNKFQEKRFRLFFRFFLFRFGGTLHAHGFFRMSVLM